MSAIDRSILNEMAEIMGEEFPELVQAYLDSAPMLIDQLEAAADQDGVDALVPAAHSLKSSSNDLGAVALAEVAKNIEHAARLGDASAKQHIPELRGQFDRARTALEEVLAGS